MINILKEHINIQTQRKLSDFKELTSNFALSSKPELFEIWNFERNDELNLNIGTIAKNSTKKVWWYCDICNDTYPQTIRGKIASSNCLICIGKYVTQTNCLSAVNPQVSSLLVNEKDGMKYTQFSDKRLDWKCPFCNSLIKNKQIKNIARYGLKCPSCSDKVPYPEKVMYTILKDLKVDFIYNSTTKFSNRMKYDFYLPEYNTIIETHGRQHFEDGFERIGGRPLEEEQENDKLKEKLAKENGIDKYIVIDCRKSDIDWIKNSIENTELVCLLPIWEVDWNSVDIKSANSLKVECLNIFLSGEKDLNKIAEQLNIHYATVLTWLKNWTKLGKCNFIKQDTRKEIVQLDMDNNFIKLWDSSWSVRKHFKNVNKVLKKERSNDQGYRFLYKKDYDYHIKNNIDFNFYENKKVSKRIVQLTMAGEFIKEWESMIDASRSLGKKNQSGIAGVCRGLKKTSSGYRWMFLEDYQKTIQE